MPDPLQYFGEDGEHYVEEVSALESVSDGFQQSNGTPNAIEDGWDWEGESAHAMAFGLEDIALIEMSVQAQNPDGPPRAFEDDLALLDEAGHYEEPTLDTFEWSNPINPNAPPASSQSWDDSWDWDEVTSPELSSEGFQQSDGTTAPPNGYDDESALAHEEVADEWLEDAYALVNAPAPSALPPEDAWDWHESAAAESAPEGYQQSDGVPAAADLARSDDSADSNDDHIDEDFFDHFANVDASPNAIEDAWVDDPEVDDDIFDHFANTDAWPNAIEDGWLEFAEEFEEADYSTPAVGPDGVTIPSLPPADAWPHDDWAEDYEILAEEPLSLIGSTNLQGTAATATSATAFLTTHPQYRPSRVNIAVYQASSDGLYWGRYPTGNKPSGMTGAAAVLLSATGTLTSPGPTRGISVSGSSFIEASTGAPIQLRGGNMTGLENSAVQQNPVWYGQTPAWSVYATWKPNVVRIPLNAASWLGLTVYPTAGAQGSPTWGTPVSADPAANYRATVAAAVTAARAINCYIIFDLHWCAPQITLGGVTHYLAPLGQSAFADQSTAIPFWTSMAQTYGTQVGGNDIMFELFNEPFLDSFGGTLSAGSPDLALLNGGTSNRFANNSQGGTNFDLAVTWTLAGYQAMLNAIRATGAHNVCLVNGNSYTQQLQNHSVWTPTDAIGQFAYAWHPYAHSTYPYTGDPYGKTGNDSAAGTASFAQHAESILAAGKPVLITEDGGRAGTAATATPSEPHMAYMQNWADLHEAGYLFWQWNFPRPFGEASIDFYATAFASDGTTIVPVKGEGDTTYAWMTGPLVMYANGSIDRTRWPASNDYSFGATPPVNLAYTSNPESGHTQSLAILGQFSGWQQATDWATGPQFGLDITGYVAIQLDAYVPTGCTLQMAAHYTRSGGDDIATSTLLPDIQSSCGALTANAWNTNKVIRLSHLGMLGSDSYYKFLIQQSTAGPAQLDNVKFVRGLTSFLYNHNAMVGNWSAAAVNGSVNTSTSPSVVGPNCFPLNQPALGTTVAAQKVIKLTGTAVNPVLVFTCAGGFAVSSLTRFTVGLLPTKAGYAYSMQFYNTAGAAVGIAVTLASYTPNDFGVNAQNFTVFDVPLSAFGAIGSTIGSIRITETSANTTNAVYVTAPAFTS